MALSALRLWLMFCIPLLVNAQPTISSPKDYTSKLYDSIMKNLPDQDRCPGYACYIPDGHMWSLKLTIDGKETDTAIVHTTYDWSFLTNGVGFENTLFNFSIDASAYDPALLFNPGHWNGNNFVTLLHNVSFAGNISMPTIKETGFRNATCKANGGDCWDSSSYWLYQAFRVADTSRSDQETDHNWLIGFAHNEDVWDPNNNGNEQHFKHVGVRYSNDSGRSWTRSVPILTRGIQGQDRAGTGDMAIMWNYRERVWQAFTTEDPGNKEAVAPGLIMAYSPDIYARPGTWCRIEPRGDTPRSSWRTAPGYHLQSQPQLRETNLTADVTKRCVNPSIIFDADTEYYHMICQIGAGGLRYSNSSDGWIWTIPETLPYPGGVARYPSMMGWGGDTWTRGWTKLYYWNSTGFDDHHPDYRKMWGVDVQFPPTDKSPIGELGGLPTCNNGATNAVLQVQ